MFSEVAEDMIADKLGTPRPRGVAHDDPTGGSRGTYRAEYPYQYNTGAWSTSEAGGLTINLGLINLYNYLNSFVPGKYELEGLYLYSLDAFNERTQPPHSNSYVALGRHTGKVGLRSPLTPAPTSRSS